MNDDYVFRVKVISTTTNLQDDVFKNAVQGLVKICFPQGVLEEIGIDVLERHMREEKAPEENIRKMVDVFRGEMVHRISSILAVYLDTPEKVQVGIDAVKAASEALHGNVEPDERSTNTSNHGEPKDTFEEMIVDASNDPAAQAVTRPTKVMSKRGKEKEKLRSQTMQAMTLKWGLRARSRRTKHYRHR
jgi:hypothetical protein